MVLTSTVELQPITGTLDKIRTGGYSRSRDSGQPVYRTDGRATRIQMPAIQYGCLGVAGWTKTRTFGSFHGWLPISKRRSS
jgi:hypothetical protein